MNIIRKYKIAIADILKKSPDDVFLFWKGRVALFTILKSMGIKPGDEVILPGFTCVVVPNAIKYLDAKPIYTDIIEDTLNPTYKQVVDSVTSNTKVIIVQNTFGLSSDVERISEFAKRRGIFTIEDCTHGFGGNYNSKPNGSYCDAAFYSTQWNKPFSTGIGGFAVINNSNFLSQMRIYSDNLHHPALLDEFRLLLLNLAYKLTMRPKAYWLIRDLYRILSNHGLVIGSSNKAELNSIKMPDDYFKGTTYVQAWLGNRRIKGIEKSLVKRREYALQYTNFLVKHGKIHISEQNFQNHSFLKYPLIVKEREIFQKKAIKAHIPLSDWFVSPIHPVLENFKLWSINLEKIPTAKKISTQIVNLPTEGADIDKVLKFLYEEKELIV
jgi:perosamine synthetase